MGAIQRRLAWPSLLAVQMQTPCDVVAGCEACARSFCTSGTLTQNPKTKRYGTRKKECQPSKKQVFAFSASWRSKLTACGVPFFSAVSPKIAANSRYQLTSAPSSQYTTASVLVTMSLASPQEGSQGHGGRQGRVPCDATGGTATHWWHCRPPAG